VKVVALVTVVALLAGCFGYNSSAKKWAYVGDALMIVGGGAAIALDQTEKAEPCPSAGGCYTAPIGGGFVAGMVLVTAGVFGIIFNATRTNVKTSR
jgi:hypothetical protein